MNGWISRSFVVSKGQKTVFILGGVLILIFLPAGTLLRDFGFFHSLSIVLLAALLIYARYLRLRR